MNGPHTTQDVFDFASVDEALEAAIEAYGSNAQTAAAWSALNAHFDGRKGDYRLWAAVFMKFEGDTRLAN